MLKITENVITGMVAHARGEAPIEACGYLAKKEGVVVHQYKMKNMDASKMHFTLDPEEQFKAMRDMRDKGFKLAGVYHSHPTTSAHPSKEDIRLAYDPDISYVIVSLADGSENVKSFKINESRVEPEPIDIVRQSPGNRGVEQGQTRFYELPPTLEAEIDDLEAYIHRFKKGEISARELKARRVPFGIYAQRTEGTFMIRIRIPCGCLTPLQFKAVGRLAARYGNDSVHITTRQGLQIHEVALDDLVPVVRELYEVGLSTRGGGGNTVRNITASWNAGISTDEVFDVTPYALSLTSRLIAEPDSWLIPRKFKISFSNSANDNAGATFNDLGFIARIKNGRKGFRVYVAGGMGSKPRVGDLLHDFIEADQTYRVAEAVKRLFLKYGNRKNKHAARLRFLWNKLGREKFVALYETEFENLQAMSAEPFTVSEIENAPKPDIPLEPHAPTSPEFDLWKRRYVHRQKQPGLHTVLIPLLLGELGSEHAVALADFLGNFGDNVLRCSIEQNLSVRNIPHEFLGNLYQVATAITDLSTRPQFIANGIACAGADTCTLGICLSRGAMRAIDSKLKRSTLNVDAISDLKLNISGCPDTCGLHMTADLGFQGKSSRKNQILYPAYNIVAGAIVKDGQSRLARKIDMISARDLPDFVAELLEVYLSKKHNYSSFAAYIDDCGEADIKNICDRHRDIPALENDKSYYFDWGAKEVFSLVAMGMGECSAGLFDLIDVDRDIIKNQQKKIESLTDRNAIVEALYLITLSASRMLLITRGVEARSDRDVFQEFLRHFIESGLVEGRFKALIEAAQRRDGEALRKLEPQIHELAADMETLYESMDDSLAFPAERKADIKTPDLSGNASDSSDVVFRDYRGVACPMNFVKVKIDLAAMAPGRLLKVLLDDGEPIENVPRSVADEGHEIVELKNEGSHWSVLIRKQHVG